MNKLISVFVAMDSNALHGFTIQIRGEARVFFLKVVCQAAQLLLHTTTALGILYCAVIKTPSSERRSKSAFCY